MHGMPPYDYFAIPPEKGRIPVHRTDVGTLILADLIGARSCIFIKDEKGLYIGRSQKESPCGIHSPNRRKGAFAEGSGRFNHRTSLP